MMKGWRKTGDNIWKKLHKNQWVYITWYGYQNASENNVFYDVRLTNDRNKGGNSLAKGFKTKGQAIAFAKEYMELN